MRQEIKVPAMGESISEATVGAILKPSGSIVQMDEEILELETDKVNQVLFAPQAGTIFFNVSPNDVVKIGQEIGYVDSEGAEAVQPKQEAKKKVPEKAAQTPAKTSIPLPKEESPKADIKAAEIPARLTKEDYLAEIKPKSTPEVGGEVKEKEKRETRQKMSRIRKVIAARLVEVQQTTAMLTTFNEIDLTEVIALREKYKESFAKTHGVRLGFMSFFIAATVFALKEFPNLNSYIDGDEIVHREYYDIGVAVGTDRGLVVPVVRNCDQLSFAQVESAIENFSNKAKAGTLTIDDMQGGGFTITNGGVYGSLLSTPILNPPQCGILGMHKIIKRPVVVDDQIVIRPMMYVALSYDHRLIDGKEAIYFLVKIKDCLEDPARLFLKI